jgi:hypothetical protein
MSFARRSFAGGAVSTTLTSGIGAADTSCTLISPTGWPSGANGYFYIAIEAGTTSEEKILCASTVGSVVTFVTRGQDGTSPAGHNAGVPVIHCGTATDFDEANNLVSQVLGSIGPNGTFLQSTGSTIQWSGLAASCRVHRAAAFTSSSSFASFVFDRVDFDTASAYNATTGQYTVPVGMGGKYQVAGVAMVTCTAATEWLLAAIYKNGAEVARGPYGWNTVGGGQLNCGVSDLVSCAAGDVLAIAAICSTAGLDGGVGSSSCYASFVKVAP